MICSSLPYQLYRAAVCKLASEWPCVTGACQCVAICNRGMHDPLFNFAGPQASSHLTSTPCSSGQCSYPCSCPSGQYAGMLDPGISSMLRTMVRLRQPGVCFGPLLAGPNGALASAQSLLSQWAAWHMFLPYVSKYIIARGSATASGAASDPGAEPPWHLPSVLPAKPMLRAGTCHRVSPCVSPCVSVCLRVSPCVSPCVTVCHRVSPCVTVQHQL